MANTRIEWAEKTWNPITGCTKISEACQNCYAERMSKRLAGRCGYDKENPFKVTMHQGKLDEPLRWRKPSRIFVCSMGDLFHEDVPDQMISQVWNCMRLAPWHTYMILTKRPERMNDFFTRLANTFPNEYPAPYIWLGVTAENQPRFDERTEILRQIPAAVRFVSIEPMLGSIVMRQKARNEQEIVQATIMGLLEDYSRPVAHGINWVICGGETGPGARPMRPDWVRSLRDQCQAAGTPFFFKSWGDYCYPDQMPEDTYRGVDAAVNLAGHGDYNKPWKVGKKYSGRLLDGREWNDYPEARL